MSLAGLDFEHVQQVQYVPTYEVPASAGDSVIARTVRGKEFARVVTMRQDPDADHPASAFVQRLLRQATPEDTEREAENRLREKKAHFIAARKIEKLGLPMKLIRVHYLFDHSRIMFFFKAANRVDFRQLVRELAAVFRTRIELRQIGVRDEAKILGGVGDCGRELCCTTFLRGFAPITVKMAKVQFSAVNPAKLTGQCGRLKCCIAYEYPFYEEVLKGIPPVGYEVEVDSRRGRVVKVNLFSGVAELVASDGVAFEVPLDRIRDARFSVDRDELERMTEEEERLTRELSDASDAPDARGRQGADGVPDTGRGSGHRGPERRAVDRDESERAPAPACDAQEQEGGPAATQDADAPEGDPASVRDAQEREAVPSPAQVADASEPEAVPAHDADAAHGDEESGVGSGVPRGDGGRHE